MPIKKFFIQKGINPFGEQLKNLISSIDVIFLLVLMLFFYMNSKGVFSFFLVLAFIQLNAVLQAYAVYSEETLSSTLSELLAMEKASFVRAELENNLDFAVMETISKEIDRHNYLQASLEEHAAEAVIQLAKETEEFYTDNPSVRFEVVDRSTGERKVPETQDIRRNAGVLLVDAGETILVVEFHFTGGILRSEALRARISSGDFHQEFLLPSGYNKRFVKVKPWLLLNR